MVNKNRNNKSGVKINMVERVIDEKYIIDSGKECIKHCPHENIRPKMLLTGDAVLKLRYLQDKYKDLDVEFLVYGNATKIDGERFSYVLDDVIVPIQKVKTEEVKDVIVVGEWNTVIHEHPGEMAGGFSPTDNEFVNSNHDFSIIIGRNNKLKNIIGIAAIQIECGRYMNSSLDIDVVIPSSKDIDFIKSTKNIKVVIDGQSLFSGIMGKAKQNLCKRCKHPLEKVEKTDKEFYCTKCQIIYVQS